MLHPYVEMTNLISRDAMPKIRIVIVEKHVAVRRALRKRLSATPHIDVVATIQEPVEALAYLSTLDNSADCRTVDVVLLGLQNEPDEELFKTIEIVRQMVRYPAAVIVLSPYADEVERLLMQQAGVSSYLLKQIDSSRLIREIETASQHNQKTISQGS